MKDLFSGVVGSIFIFLLVVMLAAWIYQTIDEDKARDCDVFGKVLLNGKLYDCRPAAKEEGDDV